MRITEYEKAHAEKVKEPTRKFKLFADGPAKEPYETMGFWHSIFELIKWVFADPYPIGSTVDNWSTHSELYNFKDSTEDEAARRMLL